VSRAPATSPIRLRMAISLRQAASTAAETPPHVRIRPPAQIPWAMQRATMFTRSTNTGGDTCFTAFLNCPCPLFAAAYLGNYDTNNLCNGYLGTSVTTTPPVRSRSACQRARNSAFVVNEISSEAGGCDYALAVAGGQCQPELNIASVPATKCASSGRPPRWLFIGIQRPAFHRRIGPAFWMSLRLRATTRDEQRQSDESVLSPAQAAVRATLSVAIFDTPAQWFATARAFFARASQKLKHLLSRRTTLPNPNPLPLEREQRPHGKSLDGDSDRDLHRPSSFEMAGDSPSPSGRGPG